MSGSRPEATDPLPKLDGLIVATLVGTTARHEPLIDFPGNASGGPVAARSTVGLSDAQVGASLVLFFEAGDASRPVIVGRVLDRPCDPLAQQQVDMQSEGERLVLSAKNEIVLRTGKASITLTRVGKILIRGAYLLSRSSGANRIQGGSIQLN